MYVEQQARYPRGTYKVTASRQGGGALFHLANLSTGCYSGSLAAWDLIKEIEADLSDNKYPQNAVQYRTWGMGSPQGKPGGGKVIRLAGMEPALPEACGPTFVIRVLFRQNATWQGTIRWIEGRQERRYRSVNELLHLIDEAMELPPDEQIAEIQ